MTSRPKGQEGQTASRFGHRRGERLAAIWIALVSMFVALPLVVVIAVSFSSVAYGAFPPPGVSLRWYRNLGNIPDIGQGLINSLVVGAASALIAVSVGLVVAYGAVRALRKYAAFVTRFLQLPFMIPRVALGLAFFILWLQFGIHGTLGGLVASHVVVTVPITVALLGAAFADVPLELEEAAWDLGSSRWESFVKVVLPELRPALIAAFVLSFIISFDEVEMTIFIADRHSITLPIAMFNYVARYQDPTAAALSTVLIVVGLILGGILFWLGRRWLSARGGR